MAFTKLESDVCNVSKLPDRPNAENGYTAYGLKATFDKASQDIKNYINNVLLAQLASKEAAQNIGCKDFMSGKTQSNVTEQLELIIAALEKVWEGDIKEGCITAEKLSEDVKNQLMGGLSAGVYTVNGDYTFTPSSTGGYKITVIGAGSRGSSVCGGMSGAVCISYLTLNAGEGYVFHVGKGGNEQNSAGEASVFGSMVAEGGLDTSDPIDICHATGGQINISGTLTDFSYGGDTLYGRGARFISEKAGIGGGGYSAQPHGTDGGDGGVIIEFIG